jgi:rhodanese-related sulfurtransferase
MARKHPQSKHSSSTPSFSRRKNTHKRNLAWLWVTLGAVFIVGLGILFLSQQSTKSAGTTAAQANAIPEITVSDAYAKYQQDAFFLDVRNQSEWDQFHLAKSTLIPLDQLQNRLSELPKDRDIVVICRSGHRSQSGVAILQQAGFTRVVCMSGGLQAWVDAGYPVVGKAP